MDFIEIWRFCSLLAVLQFLNIPLGSASGFGSCSSSSFSRSIGYILRGFLLGEVNVGDIMECRKRCIISANCVSVNVLANADGRFLCQLNSGRKEDGLSEQFVQHGAGEYYGLKEKKLCNNDGKTCDNASRPWYAFNQTYFQYVRTGLLHSEARKYCKEQKSGLVSISSEEEQTFLHKTFIDPDAEATNYIRIGMNDLVEEGVFVWEDGTFFGHARYSPNEPNNVNEEDCMALWEYDGGFSDVQCEDWASFFICETNYNFLSS